MLPASIPDHEVPEYKYKSLKNWIGKAVYYHHFQILPVLNPLRWSAEQVDKIKNQEEQRCKKL